MKNRFIVSRENFSVLKTWCIKDTKINEPIAAWIANRDYARIIASALNNEDRIRCRIASWRKFEKQESDIQEAEYSMRKTNKPRYYKLK